jgi:hypothetical protein
MLPPRIAALAIVALVIAAMTGLIVVTGTGTLDTSGAQRGVGDTSTSRPAAASSTTSTGRSSSTPTQAPTSVASSNPSETPTQAPTPTPATPPAPIPTRATAPTTTAVDGQANRVAIPAQGVQAPIGDCVVVDRALLPPADVGRTCQWLGGAGLDASSGTTVLVGEAQWADRGPAAFGRIGQLAVGEQILIYDGGATATRWRIVEVFRRAKSDGVDPRAFVGGGPRRLYLISAGGRFDAARGAFLDNVYVQAVPA